MQAQRERKRLSQLKSRAGRRAEKPTIAPDGHSASLLRFEAAMKALNAIKYDFSEGSQQRWMLALREASAARDELWTWSNGLRREEQQS